MLFLAPNVYVLEYLMNTKQISGASAESAYRFIQSGTYSFLSNMRHLVFCQILVSPKGSLSEKSFLYYFLLINKYRSLVCVLFCSKALREAARARKMCRQNRAQSRLLYLLNCPTFQIASWSALIAKLWQLPTTIFALLSPFCLFTLVRAIFKRHRNDLRDRSGDQIRRGWCRKSLGVSPALDEV